MSLFGQTARYLLLSAFLIALVGSVGFYTLIHRKIRHEVDEILVSQVDQAQKHLQHHPFAGLTDGDDNPHIEPISQVVQSEFKDLRIRDSVKANSFIPVRQFQTTIVADGQHYLVRVRLPYYEFNELARDLSIWIIIGFLVLMALSVLVGLALSSRLWRPFYVTIDQLSQFRLDQPASLSFPQAHVREFDLLSRSLGELTRKVRQQFSLQKQFTENASHELQTPLAVASAELDFLLQSQHLTENDHTHLQRATDALSRLSQLNRSLLLLTQVDNDQFAADELADLSEVIQQYLLDFEPFFTHKHLAVTVAIQPEVQLRMNRQLMGVLLTNLLKNTARHCPVGGRVALSLTNDQLSICNTGEPLPFAESQLFNRFVKDPARPDSIGLGLALVRQICDRYGFPLTYAYDQANKTHSFQIGLISDKANNFKFAT
ncbi:HAMP domain-containing histidine kinase [Spirosoma aureum]|uniref:histidine kinase n=1 Tax=Spirosoma aureum TaxID=2692134 RepID=A0A6G9AS89_9BACT|nr:HAMP domain-containing sensor histidine kinase [Spirosoma aureum]QIP15189.1 HAMP domain-containing histidine kinase [Spirosoma aureum]